MANTQHFIVRTSWLFGVGGKNFVETMLRLGDEQPEVLVVSDQVGAPTYTPHLAGAMVLLAESEDYGVHHVTASGSCSWFDFAQEIFDQAGLETRVMAARTSMLDRPAPRARPTRCSGASGAAGCSRTGATPSPSTWPRARPRARAAGGAG